MVVLLLVLVVIVVVVEVAADSSPVRASYRHSSTSRPHRAAAGSSEAECMAIGQIWLLARMRRGRNAPRARGCFTRIEPDPRYAWGMLKINAMSLAETLEVYQDLFVGALLGGGGICSEEEEEGGGRDGESKEEDGDSCYW
jgi:hypothetical protein